MWLLCDDPGARTAAGLVLHAVEVGGPLERFLAILADEAVDVPRSAHGVDRLVGDGLGAALALGAGGVDVALLAVRVPLVLVEAALGRELGPARPAREARVVPRLVHRFHAALCDEVQAACALGDELLLVVLLAEEELILGVHGHLAQVRAALSANEAALLVVQRVLRLHRPPADFLAALSAHLILVPHPESERPWLVC